jgi:TolB-like protein
MKRCPQCNRTEADDSLTFCRADGTPLVREGGAAGEEAGTLKFPPAESVDPTEARTLPAAAAPRGPAAPTTVLEARQASSRTGEAGEQRGRKRVVIAGAAVIVVAALAASAYLYLSRGKTAARNSIAVLPFTNASGDPDVEYLSDGITETLINSLSQLPDVRVLARSTTFRFKGKDTDPRAVGKQLGVDAVLTGSVVQRGDSLTVQADLVDVADGSQLWGERYNRRLTDLLAIQGEIAQGIGGKLRLRLSDAEQRKLTRRYTESTEAYQLYLRGRYFWNKRTEEGIRKGVEYFRQAIESDPNYPLPYAGLADSYNFLGAFGLAILSPGEAMPRAKAAAMRALELDESLAEAHASLAFVRLYHDWDWPGAEREFQRAIELNPNYAPAHQWYSHLLMAGGRTGESISAARRAAEIDPLSLPAIMNLGWQYHWAGEYDLAVEHLRKLLEMDPNFEQGRWGLGLAYEQKGMFEEAVAEFQRTVALSGGRPVYVAALGHACAVGGRKAEAARAGDELEGLSKSRYVPPYWMATLYAGLGDEDRAFGWLEKAYEERSGGLIWLGVDPRMGGLRSDPRFADLLRRVGLPQ